MQYRHVLRIIPVCLLSLLLADVSEAYYRPATGRFLNRDPYQEQGGLNLYRYVENAPTNLIDPIGLETIEVEFNAFIPGRLGKWILQPGGPSFPYMYVGHAFQYFKTDERGFGGGSSRLKTVVSIDSEGIGIATCKPDKLMSSTVAGVSQRKTIILDPKTLKKTHEFIDTRTATPTTSSTTTKSKCSTTVCVTASATYPFSLMAPNIDYHVCWKFTVAAPNSVTIDVWGEHDKFPNYEALINRPISLSQYEYDTKWPGPGFFSLWLAGQVSYKGNGYSVFVDKTPECCP